MKEISGGITSVKGIKASGIHCGIKKAGRDLALIVSEPPAVAAGVFTTNRVKAAPVLLSQELIKSGKAKGIIANSGNANACTGKEGYKASKETISSLAKVLKTPQRNILIASTGEIGKPLPLHKVKEGIPVLVKGLSENGGKNAAKAILTTDTVSKEAAVEYVYGDKPVRVGGIAKGSGMICPHMATMLAFITSDISIKADLLKRALKKSVDKSFNMITVDGDKSTNDTVFCLANGLAGNSIIDKTGKGFQLFQKALDCVMISLAKKIVEDGEGATKFIEISVAGAESISNAKKVALSIANSNLVKTAFFGESCNWGRIIAAAGYSGVDIDFSKTSLFLDGYEIIKKGVAIVDKKSSEVERIMKKKEIRVLLDLGMGKKEGTVWTTDLSYDYVKINADYIT